MSSHRTAAESVQASWLDRNIYRSIDLCSASVTTVSNSSTISEESVEELEQRFFTFFCEHGISLAPAESWNASKTNSSLSPESDTRCRSSETFSPLRVQCTVRGVALKCAEIVGTTSSSCLKSEMSSTGGQVDLGGAIFPISVRVSGKCAGVFSISFVKSRFGCRSGWFVMKAAVSVVHSWKSDVK